MTKIINSIVSLLQQKDSWLIDYLLSWGRHKPPQPWGAATSFAMETAASFGLIEGESNSTLTETGKAVAEELNKRSKFRSVPLTNGGLCDPAQ